MSHLTLAAADVELPSRSFLPSFLEFTNALRHPHTYSVVDNQHIWWGVLWGAPVPFVAMALHLSAAGIPVTPDGILFAFAELPLHLMLLGNPILFAILFGALGTRERLRDARIQGLLMRLRDTSQDLEDQLQIVAAAHARATRAEWEAREATVAKSRFLSNMSHEIRTPLNAIVGYTELLREDAAVQGHTEMLEDIDKIRDAARHVVSLLSSVLDLSKIESGRVSAHRELVVLPQLVREVLATMEPLATKNGNQLQHIERGSRLNEVWTDATQLRQALTNLVGNACKFTKDGYVTVTTAHTDNLLVFEIADTGVGIAADECARVFQPFEQVRSVTPSPAGGTGLGLALARTMMRVQGGDITCESSVGVGSTFRLELPLSAAELPEESADPERVVAHTPYGVLR